MAYVTLKWLIKKKNIEKWIDRALDQLQNYLADGKLNDSNKGIAEKSNRELEKYRSQLDK